MSIDSRPSATNASQQNMGPSIYKATVVGHMDPSYMGSLKVVLQREQGSNKDRQGQQFIVKCASPFYGVTDFNNQGENRAADTDAATGFGDTQQSYGMWFVPPDVGITVLCVFVNGDAGEGYWIGCVPDKFANHMIPAIGGSLDLDINAADKKKYSTEMPLPTGEINRLLNDFTANEAYEFAKKPVHPIADRFVEQGLLEDDCRGTSPSTARRNLPNMVFGISTPGPLDQTSKKKPIGDSTVGQPVSRLGGTQFVMDDGDDQYQRKTPASVGGVAYADTLQKEKGQPNIPYSEYFRIRTRTGHQLLMHNSEDLIYIGNAKGTTWIELTANGKIDIYAEDSISVHTENDINFRAARDVNIEAGRNINMRAATGRFQLDVSTDYNVTVGLNGKITIGTEYETVVGGSTKLTTTNNYDVNTGQSNAFTAGQNTDILSSGLHTEQASRIDMNGPKAKAAETAKAISPLILRENFITDTKLGWEKKYQDTKTLSSIMRRVPMHEPWLGHENFAPDIWSKTNTDRDKD